MKKLNILLIYLFAFFTLDAQNIQFEQVPGSNNTILADFEVHVGNRFYEDVNGDGFVDVFITGYGDPNYLDKKFTTLYLNDGNGSFLTKVPLPFKDVELQKLEFADIDQDGDTDLAVVYSVKENSESSNRTSKFEFYLNNGKAHFEFYKNVFSDGHALPNFFFEDVNADGILDLIEINATEAFPTIFIPHFGNGEGNFEPGEATRYTEKLVSNTFFRRQDLNNNGELDIVSVDGNKILFCTRNGLNIYDLNILELEELRKINSIDIIDLNGDLLPDVIINGQNQTSSVTSSKTQLFLNNGNGNFVLKEDFSGEQYTRVNFKCFDFDRDDDNDILMFGNVATSNSMPFETIILENNGSGNFIELSKLDIEGWSQYSVCDVEDLNNDGFSDLIFRGQLFYNARFSRVYMNLTNKSFKAIQNTPFNNILSAAHAMADVDNDGDIDVLIVAPEYKENNITSLYINDGKGNFRKDTTQKFLPGTYSKAVFIDLENDGDKDIILNGSIYRNKGDGTFTGIERTMMPAFIEAKVADMNNDGLDDLFVADTNFLEYYQNNGDGTFKSRKRIGDILRFPKFSIGDIDGDGDLDFYFNEWYNSHLYVNDGNGNLTEVLDHNIPPIYSCNTEFSDLDGDGDLDLLLIGKTDGNIFKQALMINNGHGDFTEHETTVDPLDDTDLVFFDADNDADNDFIITGLQFFGTEPNYSFISVTRFYNNDGDGNFTEILQDVFAPAHTGQINIADIDNDNDIDILLAGIGVHNLVSRLYENTTCWPTPDISNKVVKNGATLTALEKNRTYQWLSCDESFTPVTGANSPVFETYQDGFYAVLVSEGDCSVLSECYELSLADVNEMPLLMYPNPAHDFIIIEGTTNIIENIRLSNILGQEIPVQLKSETSNKTSIDISTLKTGIYFITTANGNLKFSKL